MTEDEPRWKAGLRGSLEALTEWAFEKGPGLTEAGIEIVLPHIKAAEQRGREAADARLKAVREELANPLLHTRSPERAGERWVAQRVLNILDAPDPQ